MKPFVHLSDIHFTASEGGLAKRNQALRVDVLNDLKEMSHRIGPAEAILVTGDIAFSGLPAEYGLAREWLDKATEAVGVPPTSVLCVPGNHDVTWSSIGPTGLAIRDQLRSCPEQGVDQVLDSFLEEPHLPILGPLANYNDFAAHYRCDIGAGGVYWQTDLPLTETWVLTVRGITTTLCSDNRDRRPNLVVGRTQATLALDRPNRVYMVMAHHSPDWWHDQDGVLDALRHRAHLLLCGHKHMQRIEQVDGMIRVVAGAVHPEEDRAWEPRYNWLALDVTDTDPPELAVRIWSRVFPRVENRFVGEQADGKDYREYRLTPQRRATTEHTQPRDENQSLAGQGDGSQEKPVPPAAMRPPLLQTSGDPEPERDMVRAFLDLTYPEQMQILQELGVLEEDDRDKPFVTMATSALARIRGRGIEQRFKETLARVIGQRDSARGS